MSDVVPPSDDDEYEEWRDRRAADPVMTSHGLSRPIDYSSSHLAMDKETREAGATGIRPKKPDKSIDNRPPIGLSINANFDMHYANLFSPAPSSTVDPTSSPESSSSAATTPTRRLTFSEEDPDFPLYDGDQELHSSSIAERGSLPPLIEPWDGKDDELDFLAFSPPKNTDLKIPSQPVNTSSPTLDDNDSQEINKSSNEIGSHQVGKGILKDVFNHDLHRPLFWIPTKLQ